MKLSEFKEYVDQLVDNGCGDYDVQIHAMTGRLSNNSNIDVTALMRGIDWDSHRILIQSEETLVEAQFIEKHGTRAARVAKAWAKKQLHADNESYKHNDDWNDTGCGCSRCACAREILDAMEGK